MPEEISLEWEYNQETGSIKIWIIEDEALIKTFTLFLGED